MHGDPLYLREAMQAGACGFLLKSSANEELHAAVRRTLKGEIYLTEALPAEARGSLSTPTGRATRSASLTDRQKEVLQLLAEGRSNKEIAAILGVSIKTVEFHRGQIMRALGVHTVAELTLFAVRLGLVRH
jgi:DNA-binding NarL/FixJ family response regulator